MSERRLVDILTVGVVFIFIILILFSHGQSLGRSQQVKSYNEGWVCSYEEAGETVSRTVSLPVSLNVPKGTELVLTNVVPEKPVEDCGIVFRSRLQSVQVFVNGRRIYQYPSLKLVENVVPSAWNFVRLPEGCGGQQLEIRVVSSYGGFSGRMAEVHCGNYNDLVSDTINGQMPVFVLSLLLLTAGAAVVLIAIAFRKYYPYGHQKILGFLLVFVSLWLCGESRMPLEFLGIEAQFYITMISLMLCPAFILTYLYSRWKDLHGRLTKWLLYLSLAGAGVLGILQVFKLFDFPDMLPVIHAALAVSLVYTAYIYMRAAKAGRVSKSEVICVLLILVSAFVEMILFYGNHAQVGIYVRLALLIYALNFLRECITAIFEKLRENYELEKELQVSRLELMNSQIRPHFIYNSLNSIRTLIRINPEAAYDAVYDFSTYLRANLNSLKENDEIPFYDELKNIKAYLNIEKLRLGNRLNTEFRIEEDDFPVPHLSIQPLVENAVKHGIWKKSGNGTVRITERETEKYHVIEIEDDGRGFSVKDLESQAESTEHIGIKNIRFRITELSGGTFHIWSEPGKGTKVTVSFPRQVFSAGEKEKKEKGRRIITPKGLQKKDRTVRRRFR